MKSKVRERKKENGKGGNRYSAKKERESWEGHAFYNTRRVFVSCEAMRVVHIRPPGLQDRTTGRGGT